MITLEAGGLEGEGLYGIQHALRVRVITGVLNSTDGNVLKAAEVLEVTREGLYQIMKRDGIPTGTGRPE